MNTDQDAPETSCGWTLGFLLQVLASREVEARARERAAYDAGFADGYAEGESDAEQDMADHWASVARSVRARADRPSFAERRAAEFEAARPRAGDFTGRLTPEDYFGWGAESRGTRAA